jgi:broad specificity phosphatase PhoE
MKRRRAVGAQQGATFARVSEAGICVTLVRHGQTEANSTKRWQGQGDSPLSALGVQQARFLGQRLRRRTFTHFLSSDLSRALDTARATGFSFSVDRALREFDVGSWEGLTAEEVEATYPEEMERLRRGEDVALGGGESYASFSARIDGVFDALRAKLAPGDHALVVCHGGVIGTVLSGAFGLRQGRVWRTGRAANTSITELTYTRDGALLHVFNDTLHLLPLGGFPAHGELKGSVALMCDVAPEHDFGEFAARYERDALSELGEDLSAHLAELARRHPEQRVALGVRAQQIHSWAQATLGCPATGASAPADLGRRARVAPPRAGSVCHAGWHGGQSLLLDYGLSW